jgi:hypothetical protein
LEFTNSESVCPAWLTAQVQSESAAQVVIANSIQAPVPWNATYEARMLYVIEQLGAKYSSNPLITAFHTGFCNWNTGCEVSLPSDGASGANWIAAGGSTAAIIGHANNVFDTVAVSFPTQYMTYSLHKTSWGLDPNITYFAEQCL